MKTLGQILCFSFLVFTLSCDSDETFDNENPNAKIEGEWEVKSVESRSYRSTMDSPNGQSDSSKGDFVGSDINMSIIFNSDNTFTTSGDYNQILTIESPFPEPLVIESRKNDFEGSGAWKIESDILLIQTTLDPAFQNAKLAVFTDTEMEFDYTYSRTYEEGTVTRVVDVDVNYVLEKK